MSNIPILLGKLNNINGVYTLTGHMGNIERISEEEYHILKMMDGYKSMEEIAVSQNITEEEVNNVYKKYEGEKRITSLSKWNKIGWCDKCHTHVAGEYCSICGNKIKKIMFSPPCDPFIAFSNERNFVLSILKEKYGILLHKDTFFLINNGIENNIFFWEIEYCGKIIMKIKFVGKEPQEWEYHILEKIENLYSQNDYLLSKEIKKTIQANQQRLNEIEGRSMATILESSRFFCSKPLLYFSAGKESMVLLHLLELSKIEANVLTVLTGVEFPEDSSFIKKMKSIIEKNPFFTYYFYEENGKEVITRLNNERKLSAKNPWCRSKFKSDLKNKGVEEIYEGETFVAYEGSRWYENDFRRRHPKVNFINDYKRQVWVHPLADWTSFDIWLYMLSNNLPINPMYFKGFQRTTCWLCPVVVPFHLYNSKKQYPELWMMIKNCKMEAFEDDESGDLPY